jgi:hypothetical protein
MLWGVKEKSIKWQHGDPCFIPSGKSWRTHAIDSKIVPCFTGNMNACRNAEDKLYEMGLYGEYIKERVKLHKQSVLISLDINSQVLISQEICIALDRQTPRQRCEAMVKVMEGRDEQKSV